MKPISTSQQIIMTAAFAIALPLFPLCAAAAEKPVLAYDASTTDVAPQILPAACTINIVGVSDNRNNKETIGTEFRTFLSTDPIPWITSGLENLSAFGFTVKKSATPLPGMINLDAQLIRAYTWHGSIRINAAVALDLGITDANGKRSIEKFRSLGGKANWAGSASEYVTTLNYAFNNTLGKIAVALQQKCGKV